MASAGRKVLVVGGAGYLGGAVTDALAAAGIPFAVYDNLLYEHQYLKPVDFIAGDVRDTAKLAALLPRYPAVIWLAAIVGDAACQVNPTLTVAVNQEAVRWLAERYEGRIIFTSTCSVYGQHDALLDESAPVKPLSLYAKTKLEAERSLNGNDALILRLGTAFGIPDTYSRLRMDLVVNYMTANALTKKKLVIFGGNQWRPLIHVKDISETIAGALASDRRGVYNLAAFNRQIKDIGATVANLTGCAVEYGEQKFQDQRNYRVSCERAMRDGLWDASGGRGIEDGVREIANLIRDGRIKYTESDIHFNERHVANLMGNGQFV